MGSGFQVPCAGFSVQVLGLLVLAPKVLGLFESFVLGVADFLEIIGSIFVI